MKVWFRLRHMGSSRTISKSVYYGAVLYSISLTGVVSPVYLYLYSKTAWGVCFLTKTLLFCCFVENPYLQIASPNGIIIRISIQDISGGSLLYHHHK